MQELIITLINKFGYLAISFLIALENIFPPIPSEIILTFSGFMTIHTKINIILVIISATIGSVIGAFILYKIGNILNKERLEKLIKSKVGKVLRLKKKDIEKADYWFDTKGSITVFFCRFIPIVRSLISIPAGMSSMPIKKFLVLTTFGTLIWNTVLVILGNIMGESWVDIVDFMNKYSKIVLIVFIFIIIILIIIFYKKKRK